MIIRKIKEWVRKPIIQWIVVMSFFTGLIVLGGYLLINETTGKEDLTLEERKEINLKEEIDTALEKKRK